MNISIKAIFNELKIEFNNLYFDNSKWKETNMSFEFWKEEKGRICLFTIYYTKQKGVYNFSNVLHADIIFKDVDSILRKFINLDSEYFGYIFDATIQAVPNYDNHLEVLFDLPKYQINTKEEFQVVKSKIVNYFKDYAIPFFNLMPDLELLNNDILIKLPQSEYSNYVKGESNFKALIIMKLCNSPKYNEFKTWLVEIYKKLSETQPGRYTKGYDAALNLIEFLDSGKYKEFLKNN